MRIIFVRFAVALSLVSLMLPTSALAADFNPQLILTDNDLTSYDAMSTTDVQNFITAQGGAIAGMRFVDTDGSNKTAAQIITAAAAESQINPRYILVVLQKEQSLVTDTSPAQKQLDWATGFGVCDGCSLNDPSIFKFKGFANQVRRSASIMRYYYENVAQTWIKRAGTTYVIDNQPVNPLSNATAFLYTYTPHLHGNLNFWKLWNKWFTRVYPDGSLIQALGDDTTYIIKNGVIRPFATKAAFLSRYSPDSVLKIQSADLGAYQKGSPISLPNYSLVRTPNSMVYLIIDDIKHPIASSAVFKTIGFNPDEVEDVTDADVAEYESGTFITTASEYPLGAVVQDKKTKALYYIQNGVRSVIASQDVVKANFPKKKILVQDMKQLAKYPLSNTPILFHDGTLVATKGSAFIYVVSNGRRRLIPSAAVFKSLGYQTKNVIYTDEQTLISVTEGEPLVDTAPANHIAAK